MDDREQARRAELQATVAAGKAAQIELKAIDAELAKADEPQDAYTLETTRVIEEHHLNNADAEAFKRARAMARVPALVARQRDEKGRAKRGEIDASIADDGELDEDL